MVASAPQSLVGSLDVRLPSTAAGVPHRVQKIFSPRGGSSYNATVRTRIIRFNLTSEDCLDGESCPLQFDVRNITNEIMHFTTLVPSCLLSRLLVRGGDGTIEYVVAYGRCCHMMLQLSNPHAAADLQSEGFGEGQIPANGIRTVSLKLMSGLLNQGKMLPLRMMSSLSLELTLADPSEWLHTGSTRSTDYNIETASGESNHP